VIKFEKKVGDFDAVGWTTERHLACKKICFKQNPLGWR